MQGSINLYQKLTRHAIAHAEAEAGTLGNFKVCTLRLCNCTANKAEAPSTKGTEGGWHWPAEEPSCCSRTEAPTKALNTFEL